VSACTRGESERRRASRKRTGENTVLVGTPIEWRPLPGRQLRRWCRLLALLQLIVKGTKLLFKDKEDKDVQVAVLEFDEEAKVFLARRSNLEGEAVKAISPQKFKLGMINNLPSRKMADFPTALDDQIEPLSKGRSGERDAKKKQKAEL
jgi:hypothetical protein